MHLTILFLRLDVIRKNSNRFTVAKVNIEIVNYHNHQIFFWSMFYTERIRQICRRVSEHLSVGSRDPSPVCHVVL